MLQAIDMGWFVLNKYYAMTDNVPVYAAALLLDPSKRQAYIKQNWPHEWHDNSICAARQIWESGYNTFVVPEQENCPVGTSKLAKEKKKDNQLQHLLQSIQVKTAPPTEKDDFNTFIADTPISIDCTPLEWWCQPTQRQRYPRLHRMAIDILSIPPGISRT